MSEIKDLNISMSVNDYNASAKELHNGLRDMAARMVASVAPRTMISKPIAEASIIPPYGTILRNKNGEHGMYVGHWGTSPPGHPGNAIVILDDDEPYVYTCSDIHMMREWEIVSEIDL